MNRETADYKAHLVNLERSQRTISGYIGEQSCMARFTRIFPILVLA
jgi:hypothetical protein